MGTSGDAADEGSTALRLMIVPIGKGPQARMLATWPESRVKPPLIAWFVAWCTPGLHARVRPWLGLGRRSSTVVVSGLGRRVGGAPRSFSLVFWQVKALLVNSPNLSAVFVSCVLLLCWLVETVQTRVTEI